MKIQYIDLRYMVAILFLCASYASATEYCSGIHFSLQNSSLHRGDEFSTHLDNTGNAPIQYTTGFGAEGHIYGYAPKFKANGFVWDGVGTPVIRDHDLHLQILGSNGTWTSVDIAQAVRPKIEALGYVWGSARNPFDGGPGVEERVVFTKNCELFTVINGNRANGKNIGSTIDSAFLIHSTDMGVSWNVYRIDGTTDINLNVRIEHASKPGWLSGPPALLIHEHFDIAPEKSDHTPRTLSLVTVDESNSGQLTLKNYLIATDNVASDLHSGEGNSLVTIDNKIHIVFAGPSVDQSGAPNGTIQYISTFNKTLRSFEVSKFRLGTIPTPSGAPDDHDQPVIGFDSKNVLHVILGVHNGNLYYLRSQSDNSSTS